MGWKLSGAWLAIVLWALVLPGFPQHGAWQDHYQDALGIMCCGQKDCMPMEGRLLAHAGVQAQVEVQGIPLWMPAGSIHPSEDGQFWVCWKNHAPAQAPVIAENIRCVFYVVGS